MFSMQMRKGELEARVGPGKMQGGGVAKKNKFWRGAVFVIFVFRVK
jgi:hypothetical protein